VIAVGDNEFTGQWAILPAKVRYDKDLPANAKLIYAEIAAKINEDGYCFCHNKYFAERLSIKPDTVSGLVKRLEVAGYIIVNINSEPGVENADRRRIYLTPKPYDWVGGIGNKSEGVSDLNPRVIENNNIKINNTPKAPKRGRASAPKKQPDWKPERFEKLWAVYPRGEKRQAAIVAWDKLHADDGLLNVMAVALAHNLRSDDWQRGIGIPYLSTWLNQRRWEDDVSKSGTVAVPEPTSPVKVETPLWN
jgi:hypothetical protein